jgi:hypothetical protein
MKKTTQTSTILMHNCKKWSFLPIIVDQATICNCHGRQPWCNCLSNEKRPILGLHELVLIIIIGIWWKDLIRKDNYEIEIWNFLKTYLEP